MGLLEMMGDFYKKETKSISIWKMKRIGDFSFKFFRTYIIICLSFVVLYPLLYMVSIAFRTSADVVDPAVIWLPKTFTVDNFTTVIKNIKYWATLQNTIVISLVSTCLQLITCSLAGYGLARFKFKGNGVLFGFVLFSILVPMQTVAIPMFMQFRFFDFFGIGNLIGLFTGKPLTANLYNTPFALYLPAILGNGIRGGLYIFIFRQFLKGVPMDLEDAAYIDGCGIMKTYTKIIVPVSLPPFLVTFILSVIWYWNDAFVTPFFYGKAQTLAMAVDSMAARLSLDHDFYEIFTYQQVACLLMIIPMLLMFMFLQKYFMQSIDRTGLK